MGLFRRKQATLNEQLLREAGLDPAQMLGAPPSPRPVPEATPSVLSITGVPDGSRVEPREWDAATVVEAPGLEGDRIEFTTLPDGDVIVGEETGDADVSPLADAVERRLSPPYRAVGRRQDGDRWGVGAKRIRVAQFAFPGGDKLAFSRHAGQDELRVDGEPSDPPAPAELEQLGEALGDSFYVQADRIDGDYWEVRATAL